MVHERDLDRFPGSLYRFAVLVCSAISAAIVLCFDDGLDSIQPVKLEDCPLACFILADEVGCHGSDTFTTHV